jgi:hypothetical protein
MTRKIRVFLALATLATAHAAYADTRNAWTCKGEDSSGTPVTLEGHTTYIGENFQRQHYILSREGKQIARLSLVEHPYDSEYAKISQDFPYGTFRFEIKTTGYSEHGILGLATGTFVPKRRRGVGGPYPTMTFSLDCEF